MARPAAFKTRRRNRPIHASTARAATDARLRGCAEAFRCQGFRRSAGLIRSKRTSARSNHASAPSGRRADCNLGLSHSAISSSTRDNALCAGCHRRFVASRSSIYGRQFSSVPQFRSPIRILVRRQQVHPHRAADGRHRDRRNRVAALTSSLFLYSLAFH